MYFKAGKRFGQIQIALLISFSLAGCKTVVEPVDMSEKPRNIILMIGDGMGLTQISAALYEHNSQFSLEKFPVVGFHKTHAANDLVTDSAAGATAFACGIKTYNSAIGISSDSVVCKTILEEAEENGLATGLVATATIVHATPAAFIAHQPLRILYEPIAADFLKTEIDFFIGGGKRYFDRRESDSRNLYRELEEKGYRVYNYSQQGLATIRVDTRYNFVYFTADTNPLSVEAGRNYLPFASKLAAEFLEKHNEGKGFFLMIEGSQIDWGGHANDGNFLINEMVDFNRAINAVLAFAKKRGDTLVIVTADHESGGMSILQGSEMGEIKSGFNTNLHTASMVPVFAFGPSAELFSGIYDNTDIYWKMKKAFGFGEKTVQK